jgi:peptide/nickel transport system permease protein
MLEYVIKRVLLAVPTLILISLVSFLIIELPPGDYVTAYVARARDAGEVVEESTIEMLRAAYRLDRPFLERYFHWITGILLRGDFGRSLDYSKPVGEIIGEKLGLTVAITLFTVLFTWVVAIPIGIYSATHQYSLFDYIFTVIGFIGAGIPNFLLALIIMWLAFAYLNAEVAGLFSSEFVDAPWSLAKVIDMLKHMWVPILIVGIGGTAGLIRTMRANTLDELHKPYVTAARAKGLPEGRLILKYPVRVALNPFISTVGYYLPGLVSGALIVAIVLNLPTTGPMLWQALLAQDMYLAGSFILILSTLTVIGTLISDLLLAWVDPRIRYE